MAKDTYYFSHDYNARNDPKILELRSEYGLEGLGAYWCIIETLAEDDDGYIMAALMGGLSVGYGIPKARLIEMIDFMLKIELLCEDDVGIFSRRLMEHKKHRKLLSDNGREGALKKWANRDKNSPPISPPISPPYAKERKGKERKEDTIPNWRSDFNIYKQEAAAEFDKAVKDEAFLKQQSLFYPNVNLVKTIYKSWTNFWSTEAGWENKKKSKSQTLNWRSTITKSLSQSMNKVYYTKQEQLDLI